MFGQTKCTVNIRFYVGHKAVHAATVINHVALVIASRQAEFVKLPDAEEEKDIAAAFYNLASNRNKFPRILLLIEKPSFPATGGRLKSYIIRFCV